jgi:aminopeptidase N
VTAGDSAGVDPYLPDRGPGGLDVARYELDLDYRVATNRLDARAVVHATAAADLDRIGLDLVGLQVSRVLVDGRRPAAEHRVAGWAGPWPLAERWWSATDAQLCLHVQVTLDGGRALLLACRPDGWTCEAVYD